MDIGEPVMTTELFGRPTLLLACLVVFAPMALGDAPCYKGIRDTTPAERARITAALQNAKDALPPAPEGWRIQGDDQFSVPSSLCKDYEQTPWNYGFARSYVQVSNYAQREKLIRDGAAAAAATQAKNQTRLDALQAQMQSIMQQQMALNQKRDYAGAENLQPQLEKAQAEYEQLMTASTQSIEAAGKEYERDLHMSISVQVNAAQRTGQGATPLAKPSGALTAVRWPSENPDATNDSALYLFGNWKPEPDGLWRPGTRANVLASGAHAVSVQVSADPERLADIVQQINFAKIAAIVR
jgi:hypothetical protein